MPLNFKNPVLRGFNPDPCLLRVGTDYYMATSTFEWFPGVQIHNSKDLHNWMLISRPLNRPDLLDMRGVPDSCGVWAPALSYADDKFWLGYTITRRFDGHFKDTPNYLTTCETIDGEWASPIYMNASGFDPSLFHDDDGKKYWLNMVWDHRPDRSYFKGIIMQEYDALAQKLVGPSKMIFAGSDAGLTEGPHIHKFAGKYYLITAEGGTGYEHAVTLARADNVWGPYEIDPQGHLLTARDMPGDHLQRTGHGSIIALPEGGYVLSHLCSRPMLGRQFSPMGRESALQSLVLNDEGWFELGNVYASLEIANDDLISRDYEFSPSGSLHEDFQWLRTPYPDEIIDLKSRPGWLRLIGRESPGSLFTQALVARRQQSFCYSASVCMEFEPDNFQQMAGLICYYNQHKFHYLYMSADDEIGPYLSIMSCNGDIEGLKAEAPAEFKNVPVQSGTKVYLKAETNFDKLVFMYSYNDKDWMEIGPVLDASVLSDEYGKGEGANFTGTFVGMACHDVSGVNKTSDFSMFSYIEKLK